uniref:Uncharacterized protein n=1 Tax=Oryzias latipes TaxID=8090 RepID=A0A3P9IGN4_ORYLA
IWISSNIGRVLLSIRREEQVVRLIDPLPPLEIRKDLALPAIAVTADQSSLKSSMHRLDKRRCRTALHRGSDEFLKTFLKSDACFKNAYLDIFFVFLNSRGISV